MAPIDPNTKPSKEAYNHGMSLDTANKKVQCCYCGKVVPGYNRLQHHLGGIRGNVVECPAVPVEVKEFFKRSLLSLKVSNLGKAIGAPNQPQPPPPAKRTSISGSKTNAVRSQNGKAVARISQSKQPSVNKSRLTSENGFSGEDKQDSDSILGKRSVGRFFLENGIDLGAVASPSFRSMIDVFQSGDEMKRRIPSIPELKRYIFDEELHDIADYIENVRLSWPHTGCSIQLDGWTDHLGRSLINVVADSPEGPVFLRSADISPSTMGPYALQMLLEDVLEEVGIQNVIQIVAHTSSDSLQEVKRQLTEKYRPLFWTVSATHCLSLILDNIAMMDSIKQTLERVKNITKFIYSRTPLLKLLREYITSHDLVISSNINSAAPFLTLNNFLSNKRYLERMFTSSEWENSSWASRPQGHRIAKMISDESFWDSVSSAVNASIPIVNAISLINKQVIPHLGFIYEMMDQVKEAICSRFMRKETLYSPYWNIIDEIWNTILHSELHAAGYFMNPRLHYAKGFYADEEVIRGLFITVARMAGDQCLRELSSQLELFRGCRGAFMIGTENNNLVSLSPAKWWTCFGGDCPDLQKLAIRILSQTCNGAEVYGLRRDLAEKYLSSEANVMEHTRLHKLIYLNYNLKLKQSKMGMKLTIVSDEIDPSEEWTVDETYQTEEDESERMRWAGPDTQSGSTSLMSTLREKGSSSGVQPKIEPEP